MATDYPLTQYAPHEIAALRQVADSMTWLTGQKIHALIDAYETVEEVQATLDAQDELTDQIADDLEEMLARPSEAKESNRTIITRAIERLRKL